mmetsp:Transcript_9505/g.15995  ORF Transcript_9505/g.15995 Transcript_9505/m.15995 type:complete len:197 (+) Transcript_9505:3-593(+)
MSMYAEYFPRRVAFEIVSKFVMVGLLLGIEGVLLLKRKQFRFCKQAYALKLIQIAFVFYQVCSKQQVLQDQCAEWLNNPLHGFVRDSTAVNSRRPLTMIFNCNFERVLEDKTKKVTSDTVNYYQFNKGFLNVLTTIEIVYCLICMLLFLLIIYWEQNGQNDIILGVDDGFISDDDEFDNTRDDRIELHQREQEQER